MNRRKSGFTLLEILVVVTIIGLLMAVVAPRFLDRARDADVKLMKIQLGNLERSLELYRLDNGRFPTSEQGLEALVRQPSSDPVPLSYNPDGYAKDVDLTDKWGLKWAYSAPGKFNVRSFDLCSFGPDGQQGGEASDDICNYSEKSES